MHKKIRKQTLDYLPQAKKIIQVEIEGLLKIKDDLNESFVELVNLCLKTLKKGGKIVPCGVGKSGHVGHKMASTLASTGSPAAFLHPVEAMHGDLGILNENDLLLALSYSGETEELLAVLPAAKRFNIPIACITGNHQSQLAKWSDLVVLMKVNKEACPFGLAPTTSTTVLMALGDALAVVLLNAQGFSKEDYGRFHPAGSIGRTVSLRVKDIMRQEDRFATISPKATVKDALVKMTQCRAGSVIVINNQNELVGIFTDGDFRREIQKNEDLFSAIVEQVMSLNPITIHENQMAVEILNLLEKSEIDDIPVLNEKNKVVGLVDIQDLAKFKLM